MASRVEVDHQSVTSRARTVKRDPCRRFRWADERDATPWQSIRDFVTGFHAGNDPPVPAGESYPLPPCDVA